MGMRWLVIVATLGLMACQDVEDTDLQTDLTAGRVQVLYTGVTQMNDTPLATFTVVNDSTDTLWYWGYAPESLLYGGECWSDTGWTSLFWGWCGTGTLPYDLPPQSQLAITTLMPDTACTWRLILNFHMNLTMDPLLVRSAPIEYQL